MFFGEKLFEQPEKHPGLHNCPECESSLVYPTDWKEAGDEHWWVEFRCPSCEWTGEGVHHQEEVEAFDEELDRGKESIERDLLALGQHIMKEELPGFVDALEDNLVLPEDF